MTRHRASPIRLAALLLLCAVALVMRANPSSAGSSDSPALDKVAPPSALEAVAAPLPPRGPLTGGECPSEYEPNESAGAAIDFPMAVGALNLVLCPSGDVDWFRVPMTAGIGFRFETYDIQKADVAVDTILTVYNPGLSPVAANDDRSADPEPRSSLLVYTPSITGDYYLLARGFYTTGSANHQYTLRVTNLCNESYEPDNTAIQATPFALGHLTQRTLCAFSDQDWVSVDLTAGVGYRFETVVNGAADTKLTLYDTDGSTPLLTDDDAGLGFGSLLVYTPTASGTYFAKAFASTVLGSGPGRTYEWLIAPLSGTKLILDSPCVMDQLWAAVNLAKDGDTIAFDCGSGPGVSPFIFPFDLQQIGAFKTLTYDGGGLVAFSGLRWNRHFYNYAGKTLTVRNLALLRGGGRNTVGAGAVYNAGGSILSLGPVMIENSELSRNSTLATTYGGGAVYANQAITVTGSRFNENLSNSGGALYLDSTSQASVRNSEFISNTARGAYGGAISSLGTLDVVNVLMSRNTLQPASFPFGNESGGALTNFTGARATLISTQLVSNTSTTYGGAIGNFSAMTITGSTISENTSRNGGGIYAYGSSYLAIADSAILSNTAIFTSSAIGGSYGGGILNNGVMTVTKSRLALNRVVGNLIDLTGSGGAIASLGTGRAKLDGVTIENNSATTDGGGILNTGTIAIASSAIVRNTASFGGGIRNDGDSGINPANLTLTNTLVSGNAADGDGFGIGGGLNDSGASDIRFSRFLSNSAKTRGGGIAREGGVEWLSEVTFDGNTTLGIGGGLSSRGTASGVRLNIDRSLFVGNRAGLSGAGMATLTPGAWVTNSTFSANVSDGDGGGFTDESQIAGSPVRLVHVSFVGNSANTGGALYRLSVINTLYLTSTLISRTLDNTGGNCAGIAPTAVAYSISSDATCNLYSYPAAGTNLELTDPMVGPLQWNGGATRTHLPLNGSPAIDWVPGGPSRDQRGAPRPYGASYDVGAVEAGPVVANILPHAAFVPATLR